MTHKKEEAVIQIQVVFTKTHAVILKNNFRKVKSKYKVLFNPDLLQGSIDSKYWKPEKNNTVVAMNYKEQRERDAFIATHGVDEDDLFEPIKELGTPIDIPGAKLTPHLGIYPNKLDLDAESNPYYFLYCMFVVLVMQTITFALVAYKLWFK